MKKAFTLIELLVVIAIVATLVGVLLPALSAAKVASARVISAHSLSQLIVGGRLYLSDNNNSFWPYKVGATDGTGTQWWFGFEPSGSSVEGQRFCDYSKGPLGPYCMASGGIKTDPAFLLYSPRLKPKYKDGNYGYGYNDVLANRNAMQVTSPGQMVVFATCAQVNTFQAPASGANPMIEEFYEINDTQTTVHFRHGRNALAAFLDGSVRPLSMDVDMQPGSQDMRIRTANIGRLKTSYVRQAGW